MMIKKKMIWIVSIVFVMTLAAECLTGCSGSHRGKIELAGHAECGARTDGTAAGENDGLKMREIVIDLEPSSPKAVQKDGAEPAKVRIVDEETLDEKTLDADRHLGEKESGLEETTRDGLSQEKPEKDEPEKDEPEKDEPEKEKPEQGEPEQGESEQREPKQGESEPEESEPEKKSASEYEAGQVMGSEEIARLGADAFFYQTAIGKKLYQRMEGKSYKTGCPVAVEDLRYLRVLHYGYQGEIRVGELVCNQSISEDLLAIFRKLYDARYPIEKIRLIDDYGGDDDRSSADNNTSCFNYRNVAGKESLSRHALGIAIDINPVCNPYVITDEEGNVTCAPENGSSYADRSKSFSHKIDEEDLCCRLFTEAGFTWGGSWEEEPDYMHFSRGSTPET